MIGVHFKREDKKKTMKQSVKVILASGSPRRKELFERIGIVFSVIKSDEEEVITKVDPAEVVRELAEQKARAVAKRILEADFSNENTLIVGADTVVVSEGRILGKPKDEEDALSILMSLSGKEHFVYTGVCALLLDERGTIKEDKSFSFADETAVVMYPFMEEEALAYIKTGEPMDKAGAYGIQGIGTCLVKEIRGSYENVMGFPMASFFRLACQKNFFRL